MRKKIVALATAAGILTTTLSGPAFAIFGIGDVVIDPSNLVQNTSSAYAAVKNEVNTAQSVITQLKQLESMALSLKSLKDLSSLTGTQKELALYQQLSMQSKQMLAILDRSRQLSQSLQGQLGASNMDWKTFISTRSEINKNRADTLAAQYASVNQSMADVAARRQDVVNQLQSATGETSAMQAVGSGIDVLIGQNQQMISTLRLQGMVEQDKEQSDEAARQQSLNVISERQKALRDANARLRKY